MTEAFIRAGFDSEAGICSLCTCERESFERQALLRGRMVKETIQALLLSASPNTLLSCNFNLVISIIVLLSEMCQLVQGIAPSIKHHWQHDGVKVVEVCIDNCLVMIPCLGY